MSMQGYNVHRDNYGSGVTLTALVYTPLSHYGYSHYGCLIYVGESA